MKAEEARKITVAKEANMKYCGVKKPEGEISKDKRANWQFISMYPNDVEKERRDKRWNYPQSKKNSPT